MDVEHFLETNIDDRDTVTVSASMLKDLLESKNSYKHEVSSAYKHITSIESELVEYFNSYNKEVAKNKKLADEIPKLKDEISKLKINIIKYNKSLEEAMYKLELSQALYESAKNRADDKGLYVDLSS